MSDNQTLTITGAKRSVGDFNGHKYDTTVVYVQAPLDSSTGNAMGFATIEYNWGTSVNYNKIAHLDFPFNAEVAFKTVTNGKTSKVILTDIEPI